MIKFFLVGIGIACVVSELTPITDEITITEKLMDMLRQYDTTVKFDESITEDMAHDIYNKLKLNVDKDVHKQGVKIGERKPFPHKKRLNSNRNLLLTSDGWETSDKQTVLDMHNDYRSNVASGNEADDGTDGTYPTGSDMNEFFWDDALASVAQAYSDTCYWGHNGNRNTQFYDYADSARFDYPSSNIYLGENIANMWTTSDLIKESYLTDRVDAWWNETILWHYQAYSSSTINGAGHFTQMAWADTRYLGCGFSYCVDGSYNQYYLVCNYYPGGNYLNQYPYSSGSCSSTSCDGDRTDTCDDSLCAGCMDPGFVEYGSTSNNTDCDGSVEGTDDSDGNTSSSACFVGEQCKTVFFLVASIVALFVSRF